MDEKILFHSIEKKVGQLFFIGLPSDEFDEANSDLIKKIAPGGVCLFSRNIRDAVKTRRLIEQIIENSEVTPFLSLDQEGGLVDRLRRVFEPMPAVGSLKDTRQIKKLAEITAEILRIFGFNMNFAPVVDVTDEERKKFVNGLTSRIYGNSREDAAEFGRVYLETLQTNGVLGCLKHFPGLGASTIDSHEELPLVNISQNEFYETDLFPFKKILEETEVFAVMIAHAAFPNLDLQEQDQNGKLLPSSLSFNYVNNFLRNELNFKGITITDDLEMGAIVKNYGIGEACLMAIDAGQDLLAICNSPKAINEGFETVVNAVKRGRLTESRINESVLRILSVKEKLRRPFDFDQNRIAELKNEVLLLKEI